MGKKQLPIIMNNHMPTSRECTTYVTTSWSVSQTSPPVYELKATNGRDISSGLQKGCITYVQVFWGLVILLHNTHK